MSTHVDGPADVAVGDLVEHTEYGFRSVITLCTVTRVGDTRLSVRFPNGKTRVFPYFVRRKTRVFRRLSTFDIWRRLTPKTSHVSVSFGYEDKPVSVVVLTPSLLTADGVSAVCAELAEVAAWLANRPEGKP